MPDTMLAAETARMNGAATLAISAAQLLST